MSKKEVSKEEIVEGFNKLRQEQRGIANKVSELEADRSEHGVVIEALSEVNGDRRCYRLIGGVLVERTVKDVLPALTQNRDQIAKLKEVFHQKLTEKGQELNGYRLQHNITVRGENQENAPGAAAQDKAQEPGAQATGILVPKAE